MSFGPKAIKHILFVLSVPGRSDDPVVCLVQTANEPFGGFTPHEWVNLPKDESVWSEAFQTYTASMDAVLEDLGLSAESAVLLPAENPRFGMFTGDSRNHRVVLVEAALPAETAAKLPIYGPETWDELRRFQPGPEERQYRLIGVPLSNVLGIGGNVIIAAAIAHYWARTRTG